MIVICSAEVSMLTQLEIVLKELFLKTKVKPAIQMLIVHQKMELQHLNAPVVGMKRRQDIAICFQEMTNG